MNHTEHLLTCAAEECNEVAQRITKALRFGLTEVQRGQGLTNAQRIVVEVKDLISLLDQLVYETAIPHYLPSRSERDAKLDKVNKFMGYAREQGALT